MSWLGIMTVMVAVYVVGRVAWSAVTYDRRVRGENWRAADDVRDGFCPRCRGHGWVVDEFGLLVEIDCGNCGGSGRPTRNDVAWARSWRHR